MTAFSGRDRVTVAWSPPGTTELVKTCGTILGHAVHPVAMRFVAPPETYDVLTDDRRILAGVAAEAMELIKGDGK